ncbi:MAG TPA: CxxC-x17-CxxC domain-containing protein [Planctomycetota bacterium]|nr:CxxC-x17-CxxC domain-containing protein [Planctomycetota bacterium]
MSFADKSLKCIECNGDFVYTAAEQELHKSLGYQNEPKRCTPCREAKRQRKGGDKGNRPAGGGGGQPPQAPAPQAPQSPPSQPQGGGRGPQDRRRDGGRDGGRDRGGRRDGGRPGGGGGRRDDRPPRREGGGGGGGGGQGPRVSEEFMPRETFIALCAGCGKEAVLPFKPRGDRPVYCSECFEKMRAGEPVGEPSAPVPAPPAAAPPSPAASMPEAPVTPPPEPPPPQS